MTALSPTAVSDIVDAEWTDLLETDGTERALLESVRDALADQAR